MKKLKELAIDRSKWKRGSPNSHDTYLLDDDGKMCCLGFYALACGADEESIRNKTEPEFLEFEIPGLSYDAEETGLRYNTEFTQRAIPINDTQSMSEGQRESALILLFKEYGTDLTFEG